MLLSEITMKGFKEGLERTSTLIVPYGTVEAHGTHLPLSTDTIIINEVARRVANEVDVFVAPPVEYGVCTSTGPHPGTIALTPSTLRRITTDIIRDGFSKGLRRFILVSGHGGGQHVAAMKEAAERCVGELDGASAAALAIYEILPEEARKIGVTQNDSHAGELETSLILYLKPGLVKGRDKEQYPSFPRPVIVKDKLKYWPGAVWGDPEKASKEKGVRLFNVMVESLVALVKQIDEV